MVTGTGVAVEKSNVDNNVGVVIMDNLGNAPVNSVDQILTGREPGVMVNLNGGLAGEGAEVRIRGTSIISQPNQPFMALRFLTVLPKSLRIRAPLLFWAL